MNGIEFVVREKEMGKVTQRKRGKEIGWNKSGRWVPCV